MNYYISDKKALVWMDKEAMADLKAITNKKDNVVAGFLGIGKKEVKTLEEGQTALLGMQFTRYMLRKFFHENVASLSDYTDVLTRTIKVYSPSALQGAKADEMPRIYLDGNSVGWQKHMVTRLVGHVGSQYSSEGPFFEVIVNSAMNFESDKCFPFDVSILLNAAAAKKRADSLAEINQFSREIGYEVTYADNLLAPGPFINKYTQEHRKSPGPNAMRLLEGLQLINCLELNAQKIGNCWIKQPKRSVFIALFVEMLTHRKELTTKEVLTQSKCLYKKWKAFTRNEIKKMIEEGGLHIDLIKVACEKIMKKNR